MSESKPNSRSIEYYRQLLRVRTFEERVGELFVRGATAGSMLHLSIGEEAAAVAGIGPGDGRRATASPPITEATAFSWRAAPIPAA